MAVFRQSENIWLRSYSNSVQCSNLFHYFQITERAHVPRRPCSPWCNITLSYVWVFICESFNPHQKQDASPLFTLQYECLYVRVLIPQNDWQERRQARLLLGLGGVTVTIYKLHTYLIRETLHTYHVQCTMYNIQYTIYKIHTYRILQNIRSSNYTYILYTTTIQLFTTYTNTYIGPWKAVQCAQIHLHVQTNRTTMKKYNHTSTI